MSKIYIALTMAGLLVFGCARDDDMSTATTDDAPEVFVPGEDDPEEGLGDWDDETMDDDEVSVEVDAETTDDRDLLDDDGDGVDDSSDDDDSDGLLDDPDLTPRS